jgi:hypothetical protein
MTTLEDNGEDVDVYYTAEVFIDGVRYWIKEEF